MMRMELPLSWEVSVEQIVWNVKYSTWHSSHYQLINKLNERPNWLQQFRERRHQLSYLTFFTPTFGSDYKSSSRRPHTIPCPMNKTSSPWELMSGITIPMSAMRMKNLLKVPSLYKSQLSEGNHFLTCLTLRVGVIRWNGADLIGVNFSNIHNKAHRICSQKKGEKGFKTDIFFLVVAN